MASGKGAKRATLVDASVLINFLRLGRLDLLTSLPRRELLIVPEVNSEIRRNRAALEGALQAGGIRQIESEVAADLALFARLTHRISSADASCIIAAKALGADLAVDDRVCRQMAAAELSERRLTGTEWVLLEAVQAGLLTMHKGNEFLALLPSVRYRPGVRRLEELLTEIG